MDFQTLITMKNFNKLIEAFYIKDNLKIDENSFYLINDIYLIVFRENDDFTNTEKLQIEHWAKNHKNLFENYKIEENRITFKMIKN